MSLLEGVLNLCGAYGASGNGARENSMASEFKSGEGEDA